MSYDIKIAKYYIAEVEGHAGEGAKLFFLVASFGISLLAYKAITLDTMRTAFALFPNNEIKMTEGAKRVGLKIDGPRTALIIKGDDKSGALADIFEKLSKADINVRESSGIADINGSYGVILYLERDDCEKAAAILNI